MQASARTLHEYMVTNEAMMLIEALCRWCEYLGVPQQVNSLMPMKNEMNSCYIHHIMTNCFKNTIATCNLPPWSYSQDWRDPPKLSPTLALSTSVATHLET